FLRQETPRRPSRFRSAWKLGLMLPILLPVAFAWLHRAAPAYTLTDLEDQPLGAVSGSPSFPSGVLPQRFAPQGDFLLFSNACVNKATSCCSPTLRARSPGPNIVDKETTAPSTACSGSAARAWTWERWAARTAW